MVALFQDDAEGAYGESDVYNSENILDFKIVSSNVILGPNDISLSYDLKNWSQNIERLNPINKDISAYRFIVIVSEKKGGDNVPKKVVFTNYFELKQSNGNAKWTGIVFSEENKINSDNCNEFQIHIGIVSSEFENERFVKGSLIQGSRPASTVLKTANEQTYLTFIDLYPNIEFKVNKAWENWEEVDDKVKGIVYGGFNGYNSFRNSLNNRNDELGVYFGDIDNPLQHIYDNLEEIDFLGGKVKVHWTFAKMLKSIENSIQDNSITNGRYTSDDFHSISVRGQAGNSNSISLHSFGMAIDIKSFYNPFIQKANDKDEGLQEYIKMINGQGIGLFDIGQLTFSKLVEFNADFKEKASGFTFDNLAKAMDSVNAYINYEGQYGLLKLNERNPIIDFNRIKVDVESGVINKSQIVDFYFDTKRILEALFLSNQLNALDYFVFGQQARVDITRMRVELNKITTALSPLDSDFSNEKIQEVFAATDFAEEIDLTNVVNEFKVSHDFIDELFPKKANFIQLFKDWILLAKSNNFILNIFQYGFLEIPEKLYNAFINENPDIQWGGLWNSDSNVDYMHFEIRQKEMVKYLKKERNE